MTDIENDGASVTKLRPRTHGFTNRYAHLFKVKPFEDLKPGPEPACLIEDMVPAYGITVVWGPPKSGKSHVVFDAGMHIALGWPWRNLQVRQGPVAYCTYEGSRGLHARAQAWRQQFLSGAEACPFYLVEASGSLNSEGMAESLMTQLEQALPGRPVCVVLDTLNRSFAGDENGNQLTAYLNEASKICDAFDCAVVIVHHCGWDASHPRGFSGIEGNSDCLVTVKRDGDIVTAAVDKAKDIPEGRTVTSKLKQVTIGTDSNGKPITSAVLVPADPLPPRTEQWSRGLTVLRESIVAAAKAHGTSRQADNGRTVRAVSLDHVREDFRKRYLPDGDDPKAAGRKAWSRQLQGARNRRLIGSLTQDDGQAFVWISPTRSPDPPDPVE